LFCPARARASDIVQHKGAEPSEVTGNVFACKNLSHGVSHVG